MSTNTKIIFATGVIIIAGLTIVIGQNIQILNQNKEITIRLNAISQNVFFQQKQQAVSQENNYAPPVVPVIAGFAGNRTNFS